MNLVTLLVRLLEFSTEDGSYSLYFASSFFARDLRTRPAMIQ